MRSRSVREERSSLTVARGREPGKMAGASLCNSILFASTARRHKRDATGASHGLGSSHRRNNRRRRGGAVPSRPDGGHLRWPDQRGGTRRDPRALSSSRPARTGVTSAAGGSCPADRHAPSSHPAVRRRAARTLPRHSRLAGEIGSIEVGGAADIAVCAADPLTAALRPSDLKLVIQGGHCHDPAALLRGLASGA